MNLFDVEGLIIVDDQGKILYRKIFTKEEEIMERIIEKVVKDKESILILMDKIVMSKKLEEIFLIIYSRLDVNEPFISQVFDEFSTAFINIVKTPTIDRVWKKYDQIVLLVSGFVYEGIITSGKSDDMINKLPKRNFEGVEGMKVPRGFASLLHKATKSLNLINK